jgi:hypothetical protein
MAEKKIKINRAPVMTLWAVVVAERLDHDQEAALTLGKAVAGLNAQSKGRRLGIFEEADEKEEKGKGEGRPSEKPEMVSLLGRQVPVTHTEAGVRAMSKGEPISPASVERYLAQKFKDDLDDVREAMQALAKAYPPQQLARQAYSLYEQFRPAVPEGEKGWGAAGVLDLGKIRSLAPS